MVKHAPAPRSVPPPDRPVQPTAATPVPTFDRLEEFASGLTAMQEELSSLLVSLVQRINNLEAAVDGFAEKITTKVTDLRERQELIENLEALPEETKDWLHAMAAQRNVPQAQIIAECLGMHVSSDPNAFMILFKGELAQIVRGYAHGRSERPDDTVRKGIQFLHDNRSL